MFLFAFVFVCTIVSRLHIRVSISTSQRLQAIQSWSEEFKVQLAAKGGDEEEEEEQEGGGEGDFDNAEEAQALLDFAEAIEHRWLLAAS